MPIVLAQGTQMGARLGQRLIKLQRSKMAEVCEVMAPAMRCNKGWKKNISTVARHGSLRTARSSRISQICRATNEPTVSSTSKKEILEAPIHIDTSFPYGTESPINTPAKLDEALARMKIAQKEFAKLTQEQVDVIFQKVAMEANMHRLDLAMYAVEDTKKGVIEDKVIKNHFASEFVYNKYKHERTCGVIEEDEVNGFMRVAEPLGPIVGVIPVTNPTSTVIFKTLVALKTRNCIIFSPHHQAAKVVAYTTELLRSAAEAAGAPKDCIMCVSSDMDTRKAVLGHPNTNFILATGGPGIVKASYKSGTPAIGVGAGNAPALIDDTLEDLHMAVGSIVLSKTFDNGMICASENAAVIVESKYAEFKRLMMERGVYWMSKEETKLVGDTVIHPTTKAINPDVVGQTAVTVAKLAGIQVPPDTVVLAGEADRVHPDEPMSYEKLCPVLGVYTAPDYASARDIAVDLVRFGGLGHTAILYTNPSNKERIMDFETTMPTERVLVNMPSSLGAIGDVYNFRLEPSLTLGCGTQGGSAVSENVGPKHLLNVKTVVARRRNMLWFKTPSSIYFGKGILHEALRDVKDTSRCLVVTDRTMTQLRMVDPVLDTLRSMGIHTQVFDAVAPDPDFECIHQGVQAMETFNPDLVIAFGGGSPMDAAKIMRLLYEHPEMQITELTTRFLDIRKRVAKFPNLGSKVKSLVCVPTTSGTGAEITPFAVVTGLDGRKYPIADYTLTPNMAIIDPSYCMAMPHSLTANTGYDALVHAIESYVSVVATDYTQALSLRAISLIVNNLEAAYNNPKDEIARENMHNGSAIAGMAFANAFLGITHSLAHQLGATHHVPHGLANAMFLSHVIKYNASDRPTKMTAFPQYTHPHAKQHYAEIADSLHLTHKSATAEDKVQALIDECERLKKALNMPISIKEWGVTEQRWKDTVKSIAYRAFDDQCTSANPRYPLISELEEILEAAYVGPPAPILPSGMQSRMESANPSLTINMIKDEDAKPVANGSTNGSVDESNGAGKKKKTEEVKR